MVNYFQVLNEYALKPYRYTRYKNVHIIDAEEGRFVLKRKKHDLKSTYDYLLSRNFNAFIPPVTKDKKSYTDDSYYLTPYIEDTKMPKEQKMIDLVNCLALLHNKTTYFKEIDHDYYKQLYEEQKQKCEYAKKYYNDLINYIESQVYMSPSEYQLARNINKIIAASEFANYALEEWYKKTQEKSKVRSVTLHGNLELDHFIKNEHEYFVSWDHSYRGMPIYDLIDLYNKHWYDYDFVELFKIYQSKYPLNDEEKMLMYSYLTTPTIVDIKFNEYQTCQKLTSLIDYLYRTEAIVSPPPEVESEE